MSKCGSCGSFSFEISEEEPQGSNFKMYFIRCTMCKVPFAAADYLDNNTMIKNLERKVDDLSNVVDEIRNNTYSIINNIR